MRSNGGSSSRVYESRGGSRVSLFPERRNLRFSLSRDGRVSPRRGNTRGIRFDNPMIYSRRKVDFASTRAFYGIVSPGFSTLKRSERRETRTPRELAADNRGYSMAGKSISRVRIKSVSRSEKWSPEAFGERVARLSLDQTLFTPRPGRMRLPSRGHHSRGVKARAVQITPGTMRRCSAEYLFRRHKSLRSFRRVQKQSRTSCAARSDVNRTWRENGTVFRSRLDVVGTVRDKRFYFLVIRAGQGWPIGGARSL